MIGCVVSYLIPRFERPISEYNIYKHQQGTMRGYPVPMFALVSQSILHLI